MKNLKGSRTVIVQVLVAISLLIGLEQSDLGDLPGNVDTVLQAIAVVWAGVNIVLRFITSTPLFKRD